MYDSIYVKSPEKANFKDRQHISDRVGIRADYKEVRENFEGDGNVQN